MKKASECWNAYLGMGCGGGGTGNMGTSGNRNRELAFICALKDGMDSALTISARNLF